MPRSNSSDDQEFEREDAQTVDAKSMEDALTSFFDQGSSDLEEDDDLDSFDDDDDLDDDAEDEGDEDEDLDADDDAEDDDDGDYEDDDGDDSEADEDEDDEEDVSKFPRLDKHPRFKELNEKYKNAKKRSELFDSVEAELSKRGISVENLEEGLSVLDALYDPSRPNAAEVLRPHLEKFAKLEGGGSEEDWDEDLRIAYEQQEITEAWAKKLQAERNRESLRQESSQKSAQRAEVQKRINALNAKMTEFSSADSAFESKKDLILAKANTLAGDFQRLNGRMLTVQESVQVLERAKEDVDKALESFVPRKKAHTQKRSISQTGRRGGGAKSRGSRPKSMLDVIDDNM